MLPGWQKGGRKGQGKGQCKGWGGGGGWGKGGGMGRGWGQAWSPLQAELPRVQQPPSGIVRAVASVENNAGLNSIISARFGRAPFLAVVDVADGKLLNLTFVPNTYAGMPHGVGVAVAQWVISIGARYVIGAHFGPNVQSLLQQAGVQICVVPEGTRLEDALRRCQLLR